MMGRFVSLCRRWLDNTSLLQTTHDLRRQDVKIRMMKLRLNGETSHFSHCIVTDKERMGRGLCTPNSFCVTIFRLGPHSRICIRGVQREGKHDFIQVCFHSCFPRLARFLKFDQATTLLDGIAAANHAVELVQVGQICRIGNWGIAVIVQLVLLVVLSIVDVEVFDLAPCVGNTGLELEGIWHSCIVRWFQWIMPPCDGRKRSCVASYHRRSSLQGSATCVSYALARRNLV
jgi:hypothetical protein